MQSPVTYQGGKGRLAKEIVSKIRVPSDANFYDLCCGSGAVSIALRESGHRPEQIVMVDQGPWGEFWKNIGEGSFSLSIFKSYCNQVPSDRTKIKNFIEDLHRSPACTERVYKFLLLQAAAIGGKAVWWESGKWARGSGYRDYWQPTATSSRRSPVNPMMPMPSTIYERTAEIAEKMYGVMGICGDATEVEIDESGIVYIDPPYAGTTDYPFEISVLNVAMKSKRPCWISESKPLSAKTERLSEGRAKGGITGDRKKAAHEEWLSYIQG